MEENKDLPVLSELDLRAKELGSVKKVVNTDAEGKEHVIYFRKPSRNIIGLMLAELDRNVVTACEYVFIDAAIKDVSDINYFNQDEVFYGLITTLQTLVQVKKSTFTTL